MCCCGSVWVFSKTKKGGQVRYCGFRQVSLQTCCVVAGELMRAVEELRLGAGAEHSRRRELEGALRESAAIFKRELHDKNLELAALQQQLG